MIKKKVGLIILDYNNAAATINCIDSVLEYSNLSLIKIAVIDNGSSISNIQKMKDYLSKMNSSVGYFSLNNYSSQKHELINYIKVGENLGYAKGNNIGLAFFSFDVEIEYIMILNNDILFTETLIEPLSEALESNSSYGIVSPVLYKKNGFIDFNCARKEPTLFDIFIEQSFLLRKVSVFSTKLRKRYLIKNDEMNNDIIEIELPSGACFLIHKHIFLSIGGFDENTFLYYEENILYRKLVNIGLKSMLLTTSSCIHIGGDSTKKERPLFIVKCSQESLLYYLRKYRKSATLLICYLKINFIIKNFLIYMKREIIKL